MGYNTSVTILNDALGVLVANPEQFVRGIEEHLQEGGSFNVGNHANPVHMQPSEHADGTQLIAVGGNFSTRLFTGWHLPSHHTREGQLMLLRRWAASMGYDLRKRPAR